MPKYRLEIITSNLGINRIVAYFFPDLFAGAATSLFTIYTTTIPRPTIAQIDLLNAWRDGHVIVDWAYEEIGEGETD